jgi:hypothetical protein
MTRPSFILVGAGLICATCAWFTVTRADEPTEAPLVPTISDLLARIEKLEKRIQVLETDKEHSTRQANATFPETQYNPRSAPANRSNVELEPKPAGPRMWMHLRNGRPE